MIVLQANSIDTAYRNLSKLLLTDGKIVPVVNSHKKLVDTIELQRIAIEFSPTYSNVLTNPIRNCTFETLQAELLWYMTGLNNANIVAKYLPNWMKFCNSNDGEVASNYGKYWLEQAWYVCSQLISDKHNRRAIITIFDGNNTHMYKRDTPCTLSIAFDIRDNALNMTVHMRSNDIWYGLPIDQFCNSLLHNMILNALRAEFPDLHLGTYTHFVESMHAYCDYTSAEVLKKLIHTESESKLFRLFETTLDNFWSSKEVLQKFDSAMYKHFDAARFTNL